ncbi:MAG: DUF2806 domain-containing protein [Clostridia bacterium]|nr:DUF2806 domain-containing protein [Clostridia bacterium]
MKSLISFEGFADVANNLIDKISNAVGWVVTHDTAKKIAIDTYIKDIQNGDYDPITKAALISQAKKTIKEYNNQYDIVSKALNLLVPSASPGDIDSDWLLQFMDKIRLVSESEFQIIWAKILAEECNSPGTIPKAVLHILEQMDKDSAKSFMRVASLSVNYIDSDSSGCCPIILRDEHTSYYDSMGVTLDDLIELQSLGLIIMADGLTRYSKMFDNPVVIHYHDKEYKVAKKIVVGEVVYTRIGEALCNAVHPEKVDGFFDEICVPLWEKSDKENA